MVSREHVFSYERHSVHCLFEKAYGGECLQFHAGPLHQFELSNSSMPNILFLYILVQHLFAVTCYEQNIARISGKGKTCMNCYKNTEVTKRIKLEI